MAKSNRGDDKLFFFQDSTFNLLLSFRLANALSIRTFFQPDEYFQSLEPAWEIAFGTGAGAWITWEWRERLRSSLHPLLFACVYRLADGLAETLGVGPRVRTEFLDVAPKLTQAVFAALTDYYTFKLARRAYGGESSASNAALLLSVCSPWNWFCSTRTLSNCLETTLTTLALWFWPFDGSSRGCPLAVTSIRMALGLAAVATVLRPTNSIIWIVVAVYTALNRPYKEIERMIAVMLIQCREAIISGSAVVMISLVSDRLYYGDWTFPPLRFVHFNVVQSLAVFYGRNRPDYYITEGLPLLLTTALPFAVIGCWQAFSKRNDSPSEKQFRETTQPLAITAVVFVAIMSCIAHKEVRFIYPLLPALLVVAARPFAQFFTPVPWPGTAVKRIAFTLLLAVNIALAFYISQVHQRGVIDVMSYLRHEHEKGFGEGLHQRNMTAMFMMPCHSTPWRSHLIYPGIQARALTCEPPLDIPIEARGSYLDEADQFYADPVAWMQEHMEDVTSIKDRGAKSSDVLESSGLGIQDGRWPDYLIFFEQLEPIMSGYLAGTDYKPCWKGFNTHWHDDWRRKGDVVVWCL